MLKYFCLDFIITYAWYLSGKLTAHNEYPSKHLPHLPHLRRRFNDSYLQVLMAVDGNELSSPIIKGSEERILRRSEDFNLTCDANRPVEWIYPKVNEELQDPSVRQILEEQNNYFNLPLGLIGQSQHL